MAIRVGLIGSTTLAIRLAELVTLHPAAELVAVAVPDRARRVWWDDVVDQDEVEALGHTIVSAADVVREPIDIVFSTLNPYIFSAKEIDRVRYGIINMHPGSVPRFRGQYTHVHAILSGTNHYGATLHFVTPEIDVGDVIAKRWIAVEETDTGLSICRRSLAIGLDLFEAQVPRILDLAAAGRRVDGTPQLNPRGIRTYTRADIDDDSLNGLTPGEARRKVRAFTFPPFPPAHLQTGEGRLSCVYDRETATFRVQEGDWDWSAANLSLPAIEHHVAARALGLVQP